MKLENMPKGVLVEELPELLVFKFSLRAAVLSHILVASIWSLSMLVVPYAIIQKDWFLVLFGLPFFLIGVWFWYNALMSMFGSVELHLQRNNFTVKTGIGKFQKKYTLAYDDINVIDTYGTRKGNRTAAHGISIQTKEYKSIRFGGLMKDERRSFLLTLLNEVKEKDSKIRREVIIDLSNHLTL